MKTLKIERARIRQNMAVIKERARGTVLWGMLTSDAYGLGLTQTAHLMRDEGVRSFCVSTPADAAALRAGGFTDEELLLMRSTAIAEEIETLLDAGCIATLGSQAAAMALAGIAERRSTVAEAHLKVDTGAGCCGFFPQEMEKMLSVVRYMQHVAVSGVYTELREGSSSKAMRAQLSEFDRVLDRLRKEGVETGVVHAVHSSALFRAADLPLYNVVRVDAALSGRLPGRTGLVRVGVVETRIAEERWIPVGQAVDGGRKAKSAIRAGVVPLGLGDGFGIEASLSGREGLRRFIFGSASAPSIRLQNGEKLKRLGRLGADWLLVDLTHSEAGVGAPVLIDVDPMYARGLTKTVV